MAYNVRVPVLTGEYDKDKDKIQEFMKQVNVSMRLLENKLRKENSGNGNKGI